MKPLDTAIDHVGGVTKLALLIGVGQSVVSNWRKRNSVIDAPQCVAIEMATGGKVTRKDLRPDDWQRIWPELAVPSEAESAHTHCPHAPEDEEHLREASGPLGRSPPGTRKLNT